MAQLHFYVPDDDEKALRKQAEQAKMPLSRYLAELIKQQTQRPEQWPSGYFEQVFGQWQGEPLHREDQGNFEQRPGFE
jgi:hypothetical protein